MQRIKLVLLLFFVLVINLSFAQKGFNCEYPCYPGDTLFDKRTLTNFVSDSSGRFILALDIRDNLIWKTNPWNQQDFKTYDSSMSDSKKLNKIASFFLTSIGETSKKKNFIVLNFAESAVSAVIDKRTGRLQIIGVK